MSTVSRPGGLTALAVINFVVGAVDLMGAAGGVLVLLLYKGKIEAPDDEAKEGVRKSVEIIGEQAYTTQIPWGFVCGILLILSGIGYLKCKRVLGRGIGNAYALVSMGFAGVCTWQIGQHTGMGMSFVGIIWVIYPVLTLILLNTTFKHDFVR